MSYSLETHLALAHKVNQDNLHLSTEFSVLGDLSTKFKAALEPLSNYMGSLGSVISNAMSANFVTGFAFGGSSIQTKLEKMNFAGYSQNVIPVPENFKGNLLEYGLVLDKLDKGSYGIHLTLLKDYKDLLSRTLSNRSARNASVDQNLIKNEAEDKLAAIAKGVSPFFPKATGKQRQRLRDVFDNSAQINTMMQYAGKANPLNDKQDLEKIKVQVTLCSKLLAGILDGVKKGEIEGFDDTVALAISNGAHSVGRLVERVALFHHEKYIYLHTVNRIKEQLLDEL